MFRRWYSIAVQKPILLRDYQLDAVNKVLDAFKNGVNRPAVVLATGGGKTVVMSHLIPKIQSPSQQRSKTLVLAHKEELVRQIAQTLRRVNPTLCVDIDMQRQKPSPEADIIVGSVPTLVRLTRLNWYDPAQFKAIVLDECHHATASSWTKILGHFGALEPSLDTKVVGFTATLERADGQSLGNVFEEIVYERNLLTMIEQNELCDARFLSIKLAMNLNAVSVVAGDYKQTELDTCVNTEDVNLQLAFAYKRIRKKLQLKSTLIFCVSVEHCKTLCGVLQAQGVNAQYVSGETVKHERREILEDFKSGKIDVLCNVLVFTEGTDIPNIDSLILARPTKSRPLLTQMIGRGLRLHHGKEHCHIIDMADATSLGILSVPILFGLPATHNVNKKTFKDLEEEKKEYDQEAELEAAIEREKAIQNILQRSNREANWQIKLEKRGGFADFLKLQETPTNALKILSKLFYEDYNNNWVRLERDVWGAQASTVRRIWVVENTDENESDTCSLYLVENASRQQLLASNFKCQRQTKLLINTGKLPYLLGIVSQSNGRSQKFKRLSSPATIKQQDLLFKKYKGKVKGVFGAGAVSHFEKLLETLTQRQVDELIVASDYSMDCWFVYKTLKKLIDAEKNKIKEGEKEAGTQEFNERALSEKSELGETQIRWD
ncbi:hypothetical protein PUMCH_002545 [Australozyma saopauloensis]|uniref:RNA helicase n=1 Tax=Australozyma saopauloensis TaxID=291208 RepID=A0AAX4HA84_9ASCO|nr:hypothetical protein PUMCH_002545 [[Candida] saopauloensis]